MIKRTSLAEVRHHLALPLRRLWSLKLPPTLCQSPCQLTKILKETSLLLPSKMQVRRIGARPHATSSVLVRTVVRLYNAFTSVPAVGRSPTATSDASAHTGRLTRRVALTRPLERRKRRKNVPDEPVMRDTVINYYYTLLVLFC